jgi:hypothetical protein
MPLVATHLESQICTCLTHANDRAAVVVAIRLLHCGFVHRASFGASSEGTNTLQCLASRHGGSGKEQGRNGPPKQCEQQSRSCLFRSIGIGSLAYIAFSLIIVLLLFQMFLDG